MHDAIQKTLSRVMGSLVSTPFFPLAWEKSVWPDLSTTTATQPGILLGSEVTESMDWAIADAAEGGSWSAIVVQLLCSTVYGVYGHAVLTEIRQLSFDSSVWRCWFYARIPVHRDYFP